MTSTGMPAPASRTVTELSGWMVDVDEVVPVGERLVDRVVDHLVDEMMQAPRARRPDVHPGSQTNRVEALEDSDVFCGVGCFGH